MPGFLLIQVLLWVVAALATIWILVPAVGFVTGFRRLDTELIENPADAEPHGDDPAYEVRFRQLTDLGFRPLGKTVETARFLTPLNWNWRSQGSRWLVSSDGKTLVSLYRVARANPLWASASTMFEGGGMLQTAGHAAGMVFDDGGKYRRAELADADPAELLARHQENVHDFSDERDLVVKVATLREAATEMGELTRRAMPRLKAAGGYVILSVFVMPVLAILRVHRAGSPWEGLAAGICGFAALFAVMRWAILPGRVPRGLRMAVLFAAMVVPSLGMPFFLARGSVRHLDRALDSIESDIAAGRSTDAVVDHIARFGGCRRVLARFENPATRPQTRRVLHDVLVKLNGADLGESPEAWRSWCADRTGDRAR